MGALSICELSHSLPSSDVLSLAASPLQPDPSAAKQDDEAALPATLRQCARWMEYADRMLTAVGLHLSCVHGILSASLLLTHPSSCRCGLYHVQHITTTIDMSRQRRNHVSSLSGIWRVCILLLSGVQAFDFQFNQQEPSGEPLVSSFFGVPGTNASFDYVVVGGGTAGLAIATRLAAANLSVAVIEAGGFYELDNSNLSVVPGYATYC